MDELFLKPAVRRFDGWDVEFVDGSREAFDLIVCATGYHVAYPFLPRELQRVEGAVVQCYSSCFFDDYKGLYFIGWGQARGGVWLTNCGLWFAIHPLSSAPG